MLELSLREALRLGHNYIGTEHILLGVVREGEGAGAAVLRGLGLEPERVRERVLARLDLLEEGRAPVRDRGPEPGPSRRRAWALSRGLALPFFRGQTEGEPPYCPGCGKGLKDNLRHVGLVAEGATADDAPVPLVCTFCKSCGFPLAWANAEALPPQG